MTAARHFSGFPTSGLTFFDRLARNNKAEWFHEHKEEYERDVKGPMADLVVDLSAAFSDRDIPLAGEPKRAIFRINRDVRFSKDKSPYKTNISAVLSKDGDKQSQGSFYLQVGLEGDLAAMGFYALDPGSLSAFRDRIVAKRDAWRGVVEALAASDLALSRDDALARLPRGYDADDVGELADTLKLKSFVVSMKLDHKLLRKPALVGQLADFAVSAFPLLEFGWSALD